MPEERPAIPFDLEFWRQWEGQTVDSTLPLERCLGGTGSGAVFATQFQGAPAAVKLAPATPEEIAAYLARWQQAARLSHPALVRILSAGEASLGDQRCAYLVMERAEENLAEVLAERSLTPTETSEMLAPLLGALRYLHAQGFTHGGLKPANIMAIGDQLKISTDGLAAGGDPAADSAALGALLEQVMGANRERPLPKPFAEIASHCLLPDPAARWNIARIEACLLGEPVRRPKARVSGWVFAALTALALLGLIALRPAVQSDSPDDKASPPPASIAPVAAAPKIEQQQPKPKAKPAIAATPKPRRDAAVSQPAPAEQPRQAPTSTAALDGITRVMPAIPAEARNTITGRVRINIRVSVDSAGNVTQARLEPPAASKYFTDRAVAAARAWKFPAGNAPQDWLLQFELARDQIRISSVKTAN